MNKFTPYHPQLDRQAEDYYATDPKAITALHEVFRFNGAGGRVWECACGEGHLSKELNELGYVVRSTDLIDRGYGQVLDFLSETNVYWNGDIVTNPPFKHATQFIEKALQIIPEGNHAAFFLKMSFWEGKSRRAFFKKYPPKVIYGASGRIACALNGDFEGMKKKGGTTTFYGWFIFQKGFQGDTILRHFN